MRPLSLLPAALPVAFAVVVAPATAAPPPRDVTTVMTELVAQAAPQVQAAAAESGQSSNLETVPGLVKELRSRLRPGEVTRVRVSRAGRSTLAVTIERTVDKHVLLVGSVFERRFFPGYPEGEVEGSWGNVYSMVAPYLVSPDLISDERITVDAVKLVGAKRSREGYRAVPVSRPLQLPVEVDTTVRPFSTKPDPAPGSGGEGLLFRERVPGYTNPKRPWLFQRLVRTRSQLTLTKSAPGPREKETWIRVTHRLSKTASSAGLGPEFGKQQVGAYVEIMGPFGRRGFSNGAQRTDDRTKED